MYIYIHILQNLFPGPWLSVRQSTRGYARSEHEEAWLGLAGRLVDRMLLGYVNIFNMYVWKINLDNYIYIYMYIYVLYIYIYLHICVYVYVCMYVYIYIYTYTFRDVYWGFDV